MAYVSVNNKTFCLKAYQGDQKTLLAFNMARTAAKDLPGFTIQMEPKGVPAY